IGQMSARIGRQRGAGRVIGADLVPERLQMARRPGVETVDLLEHDDISDAIRSMTEGRGADSVIDAVGMEAHGAPVAKLIQDAAGLLPAGAAPPPVQEGGSRRRVALFACR